MKVNIFFCARTKVFFAQVLVLHSLILASGAYGRESYQVDSTVVDHGNGEIEISYSSSPILFDLVSQNTVQSFMASEEEKALHLSEMISRLNGPFASSGLILPPKMLVLPDSSAFVGNIPIEEGVSPSGARTYTIPLAVASDAKFAPSLALSYNSQAGVGIAGYGWDLGGISKIVLTSRNVYYHGKTNAAKSRALDAVFALDGVPLVQNDDAATRTDFPLATATGHIIARKETNQNGYVTRFVVLSPNGIKSVYSLGLDAQCNYPSYPITEMEDINGNKVTFSYHKEALNGNYRIEKIRYNYDALGNADSEIEFSYENDSDAPYSYFAGKKLLQDWRISGILSRTYGDTLANYSLHHLKRDNVHLLSQVSCTNGNDSLPPLKFSYGELNYWYSEATATLEKKQSFQYLTSFFPADKDCIFRRGKCVRSSYNDGILIYPEEANYALRKSRYSYSYGISGQFGSLYSSNQVILFVPHLSDGSDGISNVVNAEMTTEDGFQTIEMMDVDGDGLDELVKVNFDGVLGNQTILKLKIYKCSETGALFPVSTFNVSLTGTVESGMFRSPYQRNYFWGDFRGDGSIQLLTIAFDQNIADIGQTPYASLIDLRTHALLSEEVLFDYNLSDVKKVFAVDMDGDGKTELCRSTSSGFEIYRLQNSNHFTLEESYPSPGPLILSDDHTYMTDMNADGYIDIMWLPGGISSALRRFAYTGEGFEVYDMILDMHSDNDEFMFIDVNQDRYPDLIKINNSGMGVYMNRNGHSFGNFRPSLSEITDTKGVIPGNVLDYKGMSCFIKVDSLFINQFGYGSLSPKIRYLTQSEDSFGKILNNVYEYLPDHSRYWTESSYLPDKSAGFSLRSIPLYVLQGEVGYIAQDGTYFKDLHYDYYDGVVHDKGLGFCGFARIRTYDDIRGRCTVSDSYFNPERRGILIKAESKLGFSANSPVISVQTNNYDNNSTEHGKLNPRLIRSLSSDGLTGVNTTVNYTYGAYDFPRIIQSESRIGNGPAQTQKIMRTYVHSSDVSKYVLGVVTEESIIKEGDGDETFSWKEKTITDYDNLFHPISSKKYVGRYGRSELMDMGGTIAVDDSLGRVPGIISPDPGILDPNPVVPLDPEEPAVPVDPDPLDPFFPPVVIDTTETPVFITDTVVSVYYDATFLVKEARWQYDSLGNVISEGVAPYGATEFTGCTYTYDSNGRNLVAKTDALGHTPTYTGYNKFGKPAVVTDHRGRTTTYVYDSWGNLVQTARPDGSQEYVVPAWGGEGLYTVTKYVTGQPETVIHYDALRREVRSGVKRFDGQWQYTDRRYDFFGNLHKISLPFRGESPTYWNIYTYDNYDRLVSITEASGKVSEWSYNGTSVTTLKEGITSTSTADASGNVVSVTDAGGTIVYTLRDDGQPAVVMAPGDVRTVFTYDDYGRRIKIADPSAGNRTESYHCNSDGSSMVAHTNPNGTVRMYADKYGRTTRIERLGEYDTSYFYNDDGLLTSEQSTNGTGRIFTHDSLDRVLTILETVPDGKWLQMTYDYGVASVLSGVQYSCQDGPITKESYSYSNGHKTGITLADSTVVWHLVSEDDLGLPTEIVTGNINRNYEFTAFGMPVSRRMDSGLLQDFSYQFDATTGNLLMRRDESHGKTEMFAYDSLGRLAAMGSRSIMYLQNGNIVFMDGVGTMLYENAGRPYQITTLSSESDSLVIDRLQMIDYNCMNLPAAIMEGGITAGFTYNGDGDRALMYVGRMAGPILTRYYIGGRYEYDQTPQGIKERLYLGGDAYSAPMVYQRLDGGNWEALNIGRDYLGNITHVATIDGTLLAEYSYDPWGRLRDPATQNIYTAGNEPELLLGRGFTGHEHLPLFGLINMNARLYDPVLGRFLSPDPYIQAPDFTQNFNRYSYALNNPLKYTDESGEFILTTTAIIGICIGTAIGVGAGVWQGLNIANNQGLSGSERIWTIVGGGLVGGLAGLAGGYAGAGVAAGLSVGGALGGAAIGSVSGATGGAINGFGMTLLAGGSLPEALSQTVYQSAKGAFTGAIMGGIYNGVTSWLKGDDFWQGHISTRVQAESSSTAKPLTSYEKGKLGEQMAMDKIISEGGKIKATQATFSAEDTKFRIDMVVEFDGMPKALVEVKYGPHAGYTHNQRIAYNAISNPIPEMSANMSVKEFLSLQNSNHLNMPIFAHGQNATGIWPSNKITNYTLITIRF